MPARIAKRLVPLSVRNVLRPLQYLAKDCRVAVWRVRGTTRRGDATVLVADSEGELNPLARRFFTGLTERVLLGRVPVWRLEAFLRQWEGEADLTLVHVEKNTAQLAYRLGLLQRQDWIRVPDWVGTTLAVPADPNQPARLTSSVKDDLRKVRKRGWETCESRTEEDFEFFYRTMYLPLMEVRHGEEAKPRQYADLREQFLRGHLIWLMEGETKLAGAIVERTDNVLHYLVVGTRDGDEELVRMGALAALYSNAIQWARTNGCDTVNFGGCRGWMSDGVLAYKRKWGVKLAVQAHHRKCTLLRWHQWTQATGEFLEESQLLHEEGNALTAIAVTPEQAGTGQAELERLYKSVRMPGIEKVVLVSAGGWLPGTVAPEDAVLLGGRRSARELVMASMPSHV